ncbi:MAG: lipoprotein [Perlucidibaca sp.]
MNRLLLSALLVSLLAACGQKGALYLPPETKPAPAPANLQPAAGTEHADG